MYLERKQVLNNRYILVLLLIYFATVISLNIYTRESIVTNWTMNVVEMEQVVNSGETTVIQLFLTDELGEPIHDANVSLILDMPEMVHHIEKKLSYVEDGLYQTETVLSMGGTWIGMIEAKQGSNVYYNQFVLHANGPLVSKNLRDPTDHIHLDQNLPAWVQMQYAY
ncbi:FixH family protein [Anaerobacillus sp. MEB173]|uniref:FixH family protein n=1 Tax=Anaerobacillus sp. MEB173 TaxID=3383345 RepID=UPI003F8F81CC